MLKIIAGLFFIVTVVQSNIESQDCQKNLTDMVKFYYVAEKKMDFKYNEKAIVYFEKSYSSSYLALESCQDESIYDFNHIYNYIIASENKIQKIKEDMLKFSLIKN